MMTVRFNPLFNVNSDFKKHFRYYDYPDFPGMKSSNCGCSFVPKTDIMEDEKDFIIALEIPGIVKEDVKIVFEEKTLKISGEKKNSLQENTEVHLTERRFGEFEKLFTINHEIDSTNISAEYSNGILMVKVPKVKKEEVNTTKEIKIK